MCFDERTGKFLWQRAHDIPNEEVFNNVRTSGLFSTPTVDADRLYYVTPTYEVICADAADGAPRWGYDLRRELGVTPFACDSCMAPVAGGRSPLVVGGRVFVGT